MFRATMCPSSGELTVSVRHWYFLLCMGGCLVCRPDSHPYNSVHLVGFIRKSLIFCLESLICVALLCAISMLGLVRTAWIRNGQTITPSQLPCGTAVLSLPLTTSRGRWHQMSQNVLERLVTRKGW